MTVKVCGMRDPQNIRDIIRAGADWIGMIFHPASPRFVSHVPEFEAEGAGRAGVFADAAEEDITAAAVRYGLDIVQLHGSETPETVRRLRNALCLAAGRRIMTVKAFGISAPGDFGACRAYEDCADLFLFDTKCRCLGGSGRQFDWSILDKYEGGTPFLLSGGIGPEDAPRLRELAHPKMAGVDINSRFELSPAVKDAVAVREFIKKIKERNRT
ncbi:MAG: phosphoribosylanthranilate isomerase [Firmicutes bacterium]|nr:phosphoribosylanthranilate isomerase [Bacillota bacterium]